MEHLYEHDFYGIKPELFSYDFIAGLIVGEGTFYWTKDKIRGESVPVFALRLHIRDFDLIVNVKYSLGLKKEKVYEYTHNGRHYGFLIVRNFDGLKRIIEIIYPRLAGHKRVQFVEWFKKFKDENMKNSCKAIYNIFRQKFPELYQDKDLNL